MYPSQSTPPAFDWTDLDFMADVQCSGSSNQSFLPMDYTPESVHTAITTPPKSPGPCSGPRLLPRVRRQDLTTEPADTPLRYRSNSNLSNSGYSSNLNPYVGGTCHLVSPVSAPSPCDSLLSTNMYYSLSHDGTPSRRPAAAHSRSISTSAIPTSANPISAISNHSRKSSSSSVDHSTVLRHSFPTYRNTPHSLHTGMSQAPTAMMHLAPISLPGSSPAPMAFMPVSRQSTPPYAAKIRSHRLSQELVYDMPPQTQSMGSNSLELPEELIHDPPPPYIAPIRLPQLSQAPAFDPNVPVTSVLDYLTTSNPSPSIIERTYEPPSSQNTHFWFDIRNLRHWSDFSMATISGIPDLLTLLQSPVPVTSLPVPSRGNPLPESQAQLHHICRDYFAVKVNAALKVTQGPRHIALRSLHPKGPTSIELRPQPEFLANYSNDTEKTFSLDSLQRSRVVGIVRCYQRWNTGMRAESAPQRVKYMAGLAHLHLYMREHGCRYGYIMNEVEIVCVRYGGDAGSTIPNFGYLELSDPIRYETHGRTKPDEHGNTSIQMTASLALWLLHMLAKAEPLPGQQHWKLDVGGPAATTRHKHLPRDDWMPLVTAPEQRIARRNRGWYQPDEPLSRRECGKGKRRTAKKSRNSGVVI